MFIDEISKLKNLVLQSGFSIITIKNEEEFINQLIKKERYIISPDSNRKINVDDIREIIDLCKTKQSQPFFIVISQAETMNEAAQNAFLKLLEEPPQNYHFVLLTRDASSLLSTILSRANLYTERIKNVLESPVNRDETTKIYAKRIISAKQSEMIRIYNDISKEKAYKKNSRNYVLEIIDTAIEISYKSFFATKNPAFLRKIDNLLKLSSNLKQNGNVKLHFIADLC